MTAQRDLKALRQVVRHLATGGSVQEESEAAAITTAAAGPGSSSVRVFRCGGDAAASKGFTVAMLGAGGGIGQPLSMLLKMSPLIGELRLYDVVRTLGVGADLGHMDTPAVLKAFVGAPEDKTTLREALRGCDLVTITAGVARKPGMTRDDLFAINASIVKGLIEAVADACPTAMINLISNPVNSLVPMAREVLKAKGVYDPRKLTGVTLLDIIRANTFVAEMKGLDPASTHVPVIGGHSGQTILPLLSQTTPSVTFTATEAASLTDHIRNAGTEVVDAKEGEGSATLATAYAGSRFAEQCLKGLAGESITEWAYVDDHSLGGAEAISGCEFFARKCQFGPTGVEEVLHTGPLNETEQTALDGMLDELKRAISKGIEFAV